MKRYALMCLTLAIMLTGCGNTSSDEKANKPKSAELSLEASAETETQKQTETSAESEEPDAEYDAGASAVNILGDSIQGLIPEGTEFYEYVSSAIENGEECREVFDPKTLTAHFRSGEEKFSISCCYEDVISFTKDFSTKYYKLDSADAEYIRDKIALYSALNVVFKDKSFNVSDKHTDTSFTKQILGDTPNRPHRELRYYYSRKDTKRLYDIEINDPLVYYSQWDSVMTSAVTESEPYEQTVNYYEFLSNGSDAYFRPDTTDVYYTAYTFDGDTELAFMTDILMAEAETAYSIPVSTQDGEYTVEVRKTEGQVYYVLISPENTIAAEWDYTEGVGMRLMTNFIVMDSYPEEIEKAITHAEEHMQKDSTEETQTIKSRKDLIAEDNEKYGLFDLMQPIEKGEEVEPTGVVEEWREYISSGNPYTLEFRWTGAGRNEYQVCTTDGTNYYCRHDMEIHDNDHENLGSEEWFVDGRFFQSIYELDKYDSKEVTEYPPTEYARLSSDLLFENEKYDENYSGSCTRAYKVTIGGEEYICEEWSLYLGRNWKVYIKDGNIVAWVGDFYNEDTFNTVIRLERQGDPELLRIPENSGKYVPND